MLFFPPPNGNSPAKTKLNTTKQQKKRIYLTIFYISATSRTKTKQTISLHFRQRKQIRPKAAPSEIQEPATGRAASTTFLPMVFEPETCV